MIRRWLRRRLNWRVVCGWRGDYRTVFVYRDAAAVNGGSIRIGGRSGWGGVAVVGGCARYLSRRSVAVAGSRHGCAAGSEFGVGITLSGVRGEIHHDIAVLAGLNAFGKIEIQRIALAQARERILERGGVVD